MAKLDPSNLSVTSFATVSDPISVDPMIRPADDSWPAVCTCIGICPTDDTCIALGCAQGPVKAAPIGVEPIGVEPIAADTAVIGQIGTIGTVARI
jgi:hypothetical protein